MRKKRKVSLEQACEGALLGGAMGDALGAPYEGLWGDLIPSQREWRRGYGEFTGYPRGQYTDDTQHVTATIESLVKERKVDPAQIAENISRLWKTAQVIGPGGACMEAMDRYLKEGNWSTCGAPEGQAGNGTAMRTTAVGLFFLDREDELAPAVADISRITHRDPRSVAGGVAVARAGLYLHTESNWSDHEFCRTVATAMDPYHREFADLVRALPDKMTEDHDQVHDWIARAGQKIYEFERPIITPFVIPTVLASFWAVLSHRRSWIDGVDFALQLGGDVDTTGSITGALLAIHLGSPALPDNLKEDLVHYDQILFLARAYALTIEKYRK